MVKRHISTAPVVTACLANVSDQLYYVFSPCLPAKGYGVNAESFFRGLIPLLSLELLRPLGELFVSLLRRLEWGTVEAFRAIF